MCPHCHWCSLHWQKAQGFSEHLQHGNCICCLKQSHLIYSSHHNLPGLLLFNSRIVLFLLIAFYIYKGSLKTNRNLLVINRKGILYKEETFFWNDLLSFQISLEKDMKKQYYVYYLCLRTKNNLDHKINLSMYNKKFDEIQAALLKNMGNYEVKDLGFTQIL